MTITFEARHAEGLSRLGRLATPHGTVETPLLMPVVNPNRPTVAPAALARDHDVSMVITNSYIIRNTPALKERALIAGVHKLLDFPGPIMTDSGTFQSYVYGDVDVTPEDIVAFQEEIGVDIGTILDIFSTPDRTERDAADDVRETLVRAMDTLGVAREMALALPVQGAIYPHLRESAARDLARLSPAGEAIHPIGGVVPIMEGQRYATLARVILGAKRGLHPGRAVHLFGAGHPQMLALAVYLGCDLFDSAAYAKFAHDGRLLFPWGTEQLADLEELPCDCQACRAWTPRELLKASQTDREAALASHNLSTTMTELARVREAARRGRLYDLVLERASSQPALLEALDVIVDHAHEIEASEPVSYHRAMTVIPDWHLGKGLVARAHARIQDRMEPRGPPVLLPETPRPFVLHAREEVLALLAAGYHPAFPSRLGPVPFELSETYPFSQSLEPPLLPDELAEQHAALEAWAEAHGYEPVPVAKALPNGGAPARTRPATHQEAVVLDTPELSEPGADDPIPSGTGSEDPLLEHQVRGVAAYQLGAQAGEALLAGALELEVSPRTGRVRRILADGEHVASLRAHDGLLTLKLAGAQRLHTGVPRPRLRLKVSEDSATFNAQGRSVFAKFVLGCDKGLRPGDECLVVDPDDRLVATAQLLVTRAEALALMAGPAAKVRKGIEGGGEEDDA